MPNWCSNYIEVGHEDPQKITELAEAFARGEFCNQILPVPEDLKITAGFLGDEAAQKQLEEQTARNVEVHGYGNWYDFCVNRWGTKWDVGGQDGTVDIHPEGRLMTASFDSAWSPPTKIYDAMLEQGYTVKAYYYEPGMGFAGIYDNGYDDTFSDWGDSRGAKATLPQELDDFFNISESQAEWEAENEETEDLTEWIIDGVEQTKEKTE